jgi:hypothetical protein
MLTPDTPLHSMKMCKAFGLSTWQNVHSGKWSDWVNEEVYNPTHHMYGMVAPEVIFTVICDTPHLHDNDVERARWRIQLTKQSSTTVSFSQTLASINP